MRRHLRTTLELVALTLTLTVGAQLAAPPASADDPVVTVGLAAVDDTVATGTDTVNSVLSGCIPVVTRWEHIWEKPTPFVQGQTTYFREEGGGRAHLNCMTSVLMVVRIMDDVAPLPPVPYKYYLGRTSATMTSWQPELTAVVDVPYRGPEAPVIRPFGHVTVQAQLFRELSTGAYEKVRYGCMEWQYLIQPDLGVSTDDPRQQPCAYDGAFLAAETAEPGLAAAG